MTGNEKSKKYFCLHLRKVWIYGGYIASRFDVRFVSHEHVARQKWRDQILTCLFIFWNLCVHFRVRVSLVRNLSTFNASARTFFSCLVCVCFTGMPTSFTPIIIRHQSPQQYVLIRRIAPTNNSDNRLVRLYFKEELSTLSQLLVLQSTFYVFIHHTNQ